MNNGISTNAQKETFGFSGIRICVWFQENHRILYTSYRRYGDSIFSKDTYMVTAKVKCGDTPSVPINH